MKKIVIVCGIISGVIAGGWTVLFIALNSKNFDFDNGLIYGIVAMLMAFSLIFVGIKNHRDNNLDGQISFGKAFKVGALIAFIASTIYVLAWLIDYYYFVSNFAGQYTAHEISKLKAAGASTAKIAEKVAEMAQFSKDYRNPFYNAYQTYLEILPLGLIIAVIASLILKRKPKVGSMATA